MLHLPRTHSHRRLPSLIRHVALSCFVALTPLAAASDEPVAIAKQGKAGQEVNVARYAQWDGQCQARGTPTVSIVQPPSSGRVDVRPGPVRVSAPPRHGGTNCIGTTMAGVLVYYAPEPDFRGAVEFMYEVQSTNGRTRYRATVVVE